jgi:hypothetical protein
MRLKPQNVPGGPKPTFRELTDRRGLPAMSPVSAAAERQE